MNLRRSDAQGVMPGFFIELRGRNTQFLFRWECLFAREGWKVVVVAGTGEFSSGRPPGLCLLIAELPAAQAEDPAAWLKVLRPPPRSLTIAFGEPGKTTDRHIAGILSAGADDFIFTTIDDRVLVARIKALLRRTSPFLESQRESVSSADGLILVNRSRRSVVVRNGGGDRDIRSITPKEFEILTLLLCHEGNIVSREILLENIWGERAETVNPETVDKHVESVRKKLGKYGARIRTIYGSGYLLSRGAGNRA